MADIFGNDNSNDIPTPTNGTPDNIFALGGDDFVRVHELGGNDNVDGGTGSDWIIATNSGTLGVLVSLGDRGADSRHCAFPAWQTYFALGSRARPVSRPA